MFSPVFVGLDNHPTYTEGGAPIVLDSNAIILDLDLIGGTLVPGAVLTVTRAGGSSSDDILSSTMFDVNNLLGGIVSLITPLLGIGTVTQIVGGLQFTLNGLATFLDVNNLLQSLRYSNSSDNPPASVTLDYHFDNGDIAIGSLTVNITPVNDAPVIGGVTQALYQPGSSGITLSPGLLLSDVDGNTLTGATVTLANHQTGDLLSVATGATGISAVYNALTGVLNLSGTGTLATYQQLLENVLYSSSLPDPTQGAVLRNVVWQVTDGLQSLVANSALNFLPVLDLDQSGGGTGFLTNFLEQGSPVAIADIDNLVTAGTNAIQTAVITLTNAKPGDFLSVLGGGLTPVIDTSIPGKIIMTFTGALLPGLLQTIMQNVVFGNLNAVIDSTQRIITTSLTDVLFNVSNIATTVINVTPTDHLGVALNDTANATEDTVLTVDAAHGVLANDTDLDGGLVVTTGTTTTTRGGTITFSADGSYVYTPPANFNGTDTVAYTTRDAFNSLNGATLTLAVAAVNDAPVNAAPGSIDVTANANNAITGLSVSDIDAGSSTMTTTLSVTSGTLTVSALAGAQVIGSGTGTVTITGSATQINITLGALNNVVYRGGLAGDTLTMTTNDNGNTGSGGARTDVDTVVLHPVAGSDHPGIAFNDIGTTAEDTVLYVNAAQGVLANDTDPDNPVVITGMTTTAQGGTIQFSADGSYTYTPPANFSGIDTVAYTTKDAFNSLASATLTITVTAVNDAPVNTLPGAQDVVRNSDNTITGLSISDGDAAAGILTTTLSVTGGTLTVAAAGGAFVAGSGTGSVAIIGTLAAINATLSALNNIVYHGGTADDTLTMTTSDNGNIGSGGAKTDTDQTFLHAIVAGNHPGVARNDTMAATEDTPLTVSAANGVLANDTDPDGLTVITDRVTTTFGAVVDFATDGSYTYTPVAHWFGTDTVNYTTVDSFGSQLTATLAIVVAAVNDAPVNAALTTTDASTNTNFPLTGLHIADVDAGSGIFSTTISVLHGILTVVSGGAATVAGNGTSTVVIGGTLAQIVAVLQGANNITYRAVQDFHADDTFTITTTDGMASDTDQHTIRSYLDLQGTRFADTFTVTDGNTRVSGGGGTDTVIFNFKLTDATVTYEGNKIIVDSATSHTILSGVDTFVFTDGTVTNDDGSPLIDDLYYYTQYHDVWSAHVDADAHYNAYGWHENRDPSNFFDTSFYLAVNSDVKASGANPLTQYSQEGWKLGRSPSTNFDSAAYLAANSDVKAANIDPLTHFVMYGDDEGRQPFALTELLAPNGFDYVYYLNHNPDVAAAGVDPYAHYQNYGWKEGRIPNELFDTAGYLKTYADVKAAGVNPLDHYHQNGWSEGRDPSVNFDSSSYLDAYPDVRAAHVDPLMHYLDFGRHEGRSAFADGVWG